MGLITDATVRSLPARWKRDSIFASGVYLSAADPGIFRRSKSTRQMSVGRSRCCSVRLMNGANELSCSRNHSIVSAGEHRQRDLRLTEAPPEYFLGRRQHDRTE